jgi:hypothetical protein
MQWPPSTPTVSQTQAVWLVWCQWFCSGRKLPAGFRYMTVRGEGKLERRKGCKTFCAQLLLLPSRSSASFRHTWVFLTAEEARIYLAISIWKWDDLLPVAFCWLLRCESCLKRRDVLLSVVWCVFDIECSAIQLLAVEFCTAPGLVAQVVFGLGPGPGLVQLVAVSTYRAL